MGKFRLQEWSLLLADYAREVEFDPILSQGYYDILRNTLTTPWTPANLDEGITVFGEPLLQEATAKLRKLGEGTSPYFLVPHALIAEPFQPASLPALEEWEL